MDTHPVFTAEPEPEKQPDLDSPESKSRGLLRRFYEWTIHRRFAIELTAIIVLFLGIVLWNQVFVTVHSGERGVFYSRFYGGTETEWTYGEGIHAKWPWNKIYVYVVRVHQRGCKFDFLTSDALMVHIEISIRYRPRIESLGWLHKDVGPDYEERVIVPEVQSALRRLIGRRLPTELYQTSKGLLESMLSESLLQVAERYIELDDLLIKRIVLPPLVSDAIEQKLRQREMAAAYEYRLLQAEQEASRKKMEGQGIRDFQDIVWEGISEQLLRWRGIEAALELAKSPNTRIIVVSGEDGLPLIYNPAMLSNDREMSASEEILGGTDDDG